jgi:hypothetical protein
MVHGSQVKSTNRSVCMQLLFPSCTHTRTHIHTHTHTRTCWHKYTRWMQSIVGLTCLAGCSVACQWSAAWHANMASSSPLLVSRHHWHLIFLPCCSLVIVYLSCNDCMRAQNSVTMFERCIGSWIFGTVAVNTTFIFCICSTIVAQYTPCLLHAREP